MAINFSDVMSYAYDLGLESEDILLRLGIDDKVKLKKSISEPNSDLYLSFFDEIIEYGSTKSAGGPFALASKFGIPYSDALNWSAQIDAYIALLNEDGLLD